MQLSTYNANTRKDLEQGEVNFLKFQLLIYLDISLWNV